MSGASGYTAGMPAKSKADAEKRSLGVVRVPMTEAERARLDAMRGIATRAAYVRSRLFGDAPVPVQAAQDAPSAPTPEAVEAEPAPAPAKPKEEILLPPPGKPDAHGWHMRWNPRSTTAGTLSMAKAGENWRAVDLIGVELEPAADGWTLLRYSDRSLVRTEETE